MFRRKRKKLKKIIEFAEAEWVFKVDLMLDDFKKLQKTVGVLVAQNGLQMKINIDLCLIISELSKKIKALESGLIETDHNFSKFLDVFKNRENDYRERIEALEEWRDSHISWDAQSWTKFNKRIEELEKKLIKK